MQVTKATPKQLYEALAVVNARYSQNVTFVHEPRWINSKRIVFRLTTLHSAAPGGRLGYCRKANGDRRRCQGACWHVHGHFFEALFDIAPDAVVTSTVGKITRDSGNWQDKQVGSMVDPVMFSELCECH